MKMQRAYFLRLFTHFFQITITSDVTWPLCGLRDDRDD